MNLGDMINETVARLVPGGRLLAERVLTGGSSAEVHQLDLAAADGSRESVVLRAHRSADFKGHDNDVAAKEFTVLAALHDRGLAVPRPRLLGSTATWLIIDFIDGGSTVADADLDDALDQTADFLARLHALVPAERGLVDLPQLEDPRAGVLPYLPDSPLGQSLRKVLRDPTTPLVRNTNVLIHGDYWPGNFLWRQGELAAVIDWEDAHLADPLADLAGARVELFCQYGEHAMHAFTRSYLTQRPELLLDSLAIWEIYVSASALATMHLWAITPDEQARRRADTQVFLASAAEKLFAAST